MTFADLFEGVKKPSGSVQLLQAKLTDSPKTFVTPLDCGKLQFAVAIVQADVSGITGDCGIDSAVRAGVLNVADPWVSSAACLSCSF